MQMRDHQPQSPSQSSAGASPSTPLTPGASQQHSSAAENPMSPAASHQGNPLAENSSPVPGNAGPTPTWHMLLPLDLKRQRRIAEAAVRNVLVPDMRPLNWLCTPGFQHFVDVSLTDFVNSCVHSHPARAGVQNRFQFDQSKNKVTDSSNSIAIIKDTSSGHQDALLRHKEFCGFMRSLMLRVGPSLSWLWFVFA